MSREIKFRAWGKEKKAFIAGFNMVNFHSYYNKGLEPEIYRYSTTWKLSEIELMQYTGFKDKNGKEIYEGDILKYEYLKVPEVLDDITNMNKSGIIHSEVIGNIYQNPELLK